MEFLNRLKPAEVLLLLNGPSVTLPEVLKLTFLDLILKQTLQTTEVTSQAHKKEPARTHIYVMLGEQYKNYFADPHEQVFIRPFFSDPTRKILLRNLIKIVYGEARNTKSYQLKVIKAKTSQTFYSRTLLQYFSSTFSISEAGKKAGSTLTNEIKFLETKVPEMFSGDETKALAILKEVKGNIFILKNTKFKFVKKLEAEIMKETGNGRRFKRTGPFGGDSPWTTFDSYSYDFDISCSSKDSGCGGTGDSGCGSGCSGCGGD